MQSASSSAVPSDGTSAKLLNKIQTSTTSRPFYETRMAGLGKTYLTATAPTADTEYVVTSTQTKGNNKGLIFGAYKFADKTKTLANDTAVMTAATNPTMVQFVKVNTDQAKAAGYVGRIIWGTSYTAKAEQASDVSTNKVLVNAPNNDFILGSIFQSNSGVATAATDGLNWCGDKWSH
jgi:hypothetical protein